MFFRAPRPDFGNSIVFRIFSRPSRHFVRADLGTLQIRRERLAMVFLPLLVMTAVIRE